MTGNLIKSWFLPKIQNMTLTRHLNVVKKAPHSI